MKITAIIALVIGLTGTARSAERICVYVDSSNGPTDVIPRAEHVSAQMLATAGVSVEWRRVLPGASQTESGGRTIVVEFEMNTAPEHHPGAMAYARPYEGIHIVVLYDRILALTRVNPAYRPIILAHVMTHEIAHVLQGIERHSATGIMKAKWDANDYRNMTFSPLAFTSHDIDLIQIALLPRETSQAARPVL